MIQAEHYYQRVDLEGNCYIEATRDDTNDIQDCHYSVWKDSKKIHEGWITYNIQYDYIRCRKWWHGKLFYDYLKSDNTYGHLAEEYSYLPPDDPDWEPYPNNWEPVTPRGTDYFREHGVGTVAIVLECNVCFNIRFFITEKLKENHQDIICGIEPLEPHDLEVVELNKRTYEKETPDERREERIKFLKWHSGEIGVEIPLDPRFID